MLTRLTGAQSPIQLNKVTRLLAMLVMFSLPMIVSCDDEDDSKGGNKKSGEWTCKLNGTSWTAGKIEEVVYQTMTQFNAYRNNDNSVIFISFAGDITAGTYVAAQTSGFSASSYGDVNKSSTLEMFTEGELVITKVTTDSLVATFNFSSDTREVTDGKIKIKRN